MCIIFDFHSSSMKYTIIFSIFILTLNLHAQNGLMEKRYVSDRKEQSYGSEDDAIFYAGIQKFEKSSYTFHIRYVQQSQIVDLYTNDNINFEAQLLNKIISQKRKKDKYKAENYIYEIVTLNKYDASKIGKLILQNKWYALPPGKQINGYQSEWNDCESLIFKYKRDTIFSKAVYICPESQIYSNAEMISFSDYYHSLDSILSLKTHWINFAKKLKKGVIYWDGAMGTMYIRTNREEAKFKRLEPKLIYLETVKGSINTYLNNLVEKTKFSEDCHCRGYILTFSKNGKLKYIDDKDSDKQSAYESRQCKKKIKSIFKNNDLKHLKLRYDFKRSITLSNNGVYIYD